MNDTVKKGRLAGHLLLAAALGSAGCSGLLGLDDKSFGGSGGAGGDSCEPSPDPERLTEEFDFVPCPDTAHGLKARGFHLTWQEEGYSVPPPGLNVTNGELQIGTPASTFWVNGQRGILVQKPLSGAFMLIADVALAAGDGGLLPTTVEQAGVGLLVRDPASVADGTFERWISVDRGVNAGVARVHGSWSNGNGLPDQGSIAVNEPAEGRIALCRDEQAHFHIWTETEGHWSEHTSTLGSLATSGIPDDVQAGLFLYAYLLPVNTPIQGGVRGTIRYVHQLDLLNGSCDPGDYPQQNN